VPVLLYSDIIPLRCNKEPAFYFLIDYDDKYVQPILEGALKSCFRGIYCKRIATLGELPDPSSPVLQYRQYEQLDFNSILSHPKTSLANSFIIRKALIRKHFLSHTVTNWISKHPRTVLRNHIKPTTHFELDYAEFLDEALSEAYELNESIKTNETKSESEKEWWILKPGMSNRGQGIRLFNSGAQLQKIFEEWEVDVSDTSSDINDSSGGTAEGSILDDMDDQEGLGWTSCLRHFIAQPYIHPPLLLPSSSGRKFHIRTYAFAVGSLKVYVFKEMLALFASKPYLAPWEEKDNGRDLMRHLTNTCLQAGGSLNEGSVKRFWSLDGHVPELALLTQDWKHSVWDQICDITGEIFKAASQGMLMYFQTLPNVFEVFGLDFLVDSEGTAWLLEVNAFPDFSQTGEELKEAVIRRLFEGVIELAVKPFFLGGSEGKAKEKQKIGESVEEFRLVANLDLGRNAF
jgi:tubulin---tyrosine ligase